MSSVLQALRPWHVFPVFLFVGLLLYGHTLRYDFLIYDDDYLISANPWTRGVTFENIRHAFTHFDPELYIPLTFLTYQIDYLIGGTNPFGYHLTSLLLHILNSFLVFLLVQQLLRRIMNYELRMKNDEGGSSKIILHNSQFIILSKGALYVGILTGLLFLLHPLNTEAVAWLSARKDLLSSTFFLGSLLLYLAFLRDRRTGTYLLCLELFVFGLLAKVTVAMFPLVLLFVDYQQGKTCTWKTLLEKAPFFALSAVFVWVAVLGKKSAIAVMGVHDAALLLVKSTVFYIGKFFLPVHLSPLYYEPLPPSVTAPDFFIPLLVVLAIAVLGWFAWRLRQRTVVLGMLLFLCMLLPTTVTFFKGNGMYLASDRYAYLPMVGMLVILAVALRRAIEEIRAIGNRCPRLLLLLPLLPLFLFASLSYRQSLLWQDSLSIFRYATTVTPGSFIAHANYATALANAGRTREAIAEYHTAIALFPPSLRSYGNLALAYARTGDSERAWQIIAEAQRRWPGSAEIQFRIGDLHAIAGSGEAAKAAFAQAFRIDPQYVTEQYMKIESR